MKGISEHSLIRNNINSSSLLERKKCKAGSGERKTGKVRSQKAVLRETFPVDSRDSVKDGVL